MTQRIRAILVLALSLLMLDASEAWSVSPPSLSSSSSSSTSRRLSFRTTSSTTGSTPSTSTSTTTALYAAKKQKQKQSSSSTRSSKVVELEEYVDPDAPADIVGAQFFGGSAEKS
jgi:hypothetical protein